MIHQKTEKDLSSVHLGENCKTRYVVYLNNTEYFFLWSFGSLRSTSPVLPLFSLSTAPPYYALRDISSLLLCLY